MSPRTQENGIRSYTIVEESLDEFDSKGKLVSGEPNRGRKRRNQSGKQLASSASVSTSLSSLDNLSSSPSSSSSSSSSSSTASSSTTTSPNGLHKQTTEGADADSCSSGSEDKVAHLAESAATTTELTADGSANGTSTLKLINSKQESGKRRIESQRQQQQQQQQQQQIDSNKQVQAKQADSRKGYFEADIVWRNVILFIILHSSIPIGLYQLYTQKYTWKTLVWTGFTAYASALGVTGGAHRLWSHRAYKAHWSVQTLLMVLQTMAGQNSIHTWSRDHRVHHKFSETDADPHNIHRGFFFAHMGWLCLRKHQAVKDKGALIDMSDLEANKVVMFQHRNFWWLSALFTVIVPTLVPVYLWDERVSTSFVFSFMLRYMIVLHSTWLVNSAAHYVGHRPYDKRIEARESIYAIWSGLGEGFHNYHHTFPFDYAASEFGRFWNITTTFIDFCARLGLVYDRRRVDADLIERRKLKTGETGWSKWQSGAAANSGIGQAERDKQEHAGRATSSFKGRAGVAGAESEGASNSASAAAAAAATTTPRANSSSNPLAPLNNIIHELPYISGLTSLQLTM